MLMLAQRAVDAAITSGATYADVRLTHTLRETYFGGSTQGFGIPTFSPSAFPIPGNNAGEFGGRASNGIFERPESVGGIPAVTIGLGVRAFVHGYWGFAASPSWTTDAAVQLGQDAASQAALNARVGEPRPADLGTIPIVRHGRWVQPGIDPFTVSVDEKLETLHSFLELTVQGHRFVSAMGLDTAFTREVRVFVSSEGTSYSQTRYQCTVYPWSVDLKGDTEQGQKAGIRRRASTSLSDARIARGWEVFRDANPDHLAQTLLARLLTPYDTPDPGTKPVDVGKYDIVFGAPASAALVYQTLGVATELDRAMGYEANASGTSYLGPDPLQYLGTAVASPLVTLTADRTMPYAAATAQWDDEGMPCSAFPLIQKGMLVDYQTTREQAHWLAEWYAKRGQPIQSHACAMAATALDCPIQMSPNFVLAPGSESINVDDLIKDTEHGIYFPAVGVQIDQQVKNGSCVGLPDNQPREIHNGKLGPILTGASVLFNSRELWKNVTALGGDASAEFTLQEESKGEPSQRGSCNVQAVPLKVKDCAVIDVMRKA
jgi:TldD protein